jgi:hypothetical protein
MLAHASPDTCLEVLLLPAAARNIGFTAATASSAAPGGAGKCTIGPRPLVVILQAAPHVRGLLHFAVHALVLESPCYMDICVEQRRRSWDQFIK